MKKIDEFREEYYFLSNFFRTPVSYNGLVYKSSEAAFQAQKSLDPKIQEEFTTMTPREAKKYGKQVLLRGGWNEIRVDVMTDVVRAKFTQNEELGFRLLATGDAWLEEGNWWGDTFWGVCRGKGENHLGQCLMEVRKEIKDSFFREGKSVIYAGLHFGSQGLAVGFVEALEDGRLEKQSWIVGTENKEAAIAVCAKMASEQVKSFTLVVGEGVNETALTQALVALEVEVSVEVESSFRPRIAHQIAKHKLGLAW